MAIHLLFVFVAVVLNLAGKYGEVQATSESVYFTKLRSSMNPVLGVIDKPSTIDCSVSNKNVKVSLFKKTNKGKVRVVPDGKTVTRNGNVFTLTIASYRDTTEYICHGELHGNIYEKSVNLFVIATAQELTPHPEIFPSVAKPNVGEFLELTCMTTGILSVIKWYRNGRIIMADGKNVFINATYQQHTRGSISKLIIKKVKTSDAGKYRCTVTTKLDDKYVSYIEAKVAVKTKALHWSSNTQHNIVVVEANTAALIDCSLTLSNADVDFFLENKDGSLFKIPVGSGRYQLLSRHKLVINSASVEDMGVYSCKTDGVANKKVQLYVNPGSNNVCDLYKPHGLRKLCKTNKEHFTQYMSGLLRQLRDD